MRTHLRWLLILFAANQTRWRFFGITLIVISLSVSLYWSQVLHWTPCPLCWTERGLLVSLLFLFIGSVFHKVWNWFGLFVSVFGLMIGCYHTYLQLTDATSPFCAVAHPCAFAYFRWFGLFTPASLVFLLFLLITVVFLQLLKSRP
jgi:disulfide bond formation protein DsbB